MLQELHVMSKFGKRKKIVCVVGKKWKVDYVYHGHGDVLHIIKCSANGSLLEMGIPLFKLFH